MRGYLEKIKYLTINEKVNFNQSLSNKISEINEEPSADIIPCEEIRIFPLITCKNPDPIETGTAIKKLPRKASFWFNFVPTSKYVIVDPDLDIPGKAAKPWMSPKIIALINGKFSNVLLGLSKVSNLVFVLNLKINPVTIKSNPITIVIKSGIDIPMDWFKLKISSSNINSVSNAVGRVNRVIIIINFVKINPCSFISAILSLVISFRI